MATSYFSSLKIGDLVTVRTDCKVPSSLKEWGGEEELTITDIFRRRPLNKSSCRVRRADGQEIDHYWIVWFRPIDWSASVEDYKFVFGE